MTTLNEEEIKTLKEVAQNLQSATRVGKTVQTALLWLAGIIGSWVVVTEFILKNLGKS